ncbi:hypothetical protein P3T24_007539, partial [Paraburkholderia sp. GAS33]
MVDDFHRRLQLCLARDFAVTGQQRGRDDVVREIDVECAF